MEKLWMKNDIIRQGKYFFSCYKRVSERMNKKRFVRLIKYYFSFDERKKLLDQQQMKKYQTMKIEDLDYCFGKLKSRYAFHDEISSGLGKFVILLLSASILAGFIKFILAFARTIPQTTNLTTRETQSVLLVLGVVVIFVLATLIITLLLYRKYVNDLKIKVERVEKIVNQRQGNKQKKGKF